MRIGNNQAIIVLEKADYPLVWPSTNITIPDGGKTWLIIENTGTLLQTITGGEVGSFLLLTCKETGTQFQIEKGFGISWENYDSGSFISGNWLSLFPKQSALLQKTSDGTWVIVTMTQGATGDLGFQGAQGFQGSGGFQGDSGITGNDGIPGATGNQGVQGIIGPDGSQGGAGSAGIQGLNGIQGAQGTLGDNGPAGSQGAQGPQGSQGLFGFTGIQGAQGLPCP